MSLPISVTYTFATATSSIPLSQLDANFTTVVNGINGIGNGTNALANVNITGGNAIVSSLTSPIHNSSTTLSLQTGGTTGLYIDASQNVGIGTSSPGYTLDVRATTGSISATSNTGTNYAKLQCNNTGGSYQFGIDNSTGTNFGSGAAYARVIWNDSASAPTILYTNSAERMRIDSSGDFLINTTLTNLYAQTSGYGVCYRKNASLDILVTSDNAIILNQTGSNGSVQQFRNSGSVSGYISISGSTTAYNTSSDYRLKENVTPMTTGLETISALKPVTYDWISDKSKGEGFIAHELQAVIPLAVHGEKDAVNEDGSIKTQGVDYSKIVVHLVAAIQELKAEFDAYKATHP